MSHFDALFSAPLLAAIDIKLGLFAVVAFVSVGALLASMILFTRAKLVSTEDVKIFINDKDSLTKTVPGGQTLLSALTSNGVPVPSPCGGKATCKQCKVQVISGGGSAIEVEKATFSKKDLAAGWRLSCQCKVKENMKVHIEDHILGVSEWKARVISNKNVATFIKETIIEVDSDVPYRSGGYLQIHVPPFTTNTEEWKQTMEKQY